MEETVLRILDESVAVKRASITAAMPRILEAAGVMTTALVAGRKLLFFGNGGSAADAQHLAAEFVNRFVLERTPLAALALTTDSSILTSIGNDYCFEDVFTRQIRALGKRGDVAVGFSTSGESTNVLNGMRTAAELGLHTIAFTGRGGTLAKLARVTLPVLSDTTARIQETHITVGHILCLLVERELFPAA
jgi:D-sedoheptulose 7-phosphate isomerase